MERINKMTLALGLWAVAGSAVALEIDPHVVPEINIGGRAIATVDYAESRAPDDSLETENQINTADSSLLFGFSKYLFSDRDYGFAVIGYKSVEDGSEINDDIYLHQLFVGIGGPRYEVRLGRSKLPNTLIAFPTLRDDDLLEFTHVGNGQVDAHAEEYQVYGSQLLGRWWFSHAVSVSGGLTARVADDEASGERYSSRFNGAVLSLAYDMPEAIKFDHGLRYAGVLVDGQQMETLGGEEDGDIASVVAAMSYNLNSDPTSTWGLDAQLISNNGMTVSGLGEGYQRARAASQSAVVALRYGSRPYLQTRWQGALTLAWKSYDDFDDANSLAVVPSYSYWLGSGVELLAQWRYRENSETLTAFTGTESDQTIYLGLSFGFGYTLNETVGGRQDILNLEHNMTDFGPVMGGH